MAGEKKWLALLRFCHETGGYLRASDGLYGYYGTLLVAFGTLLGF